MAGKLVDLQAELGVLSCYTSVFIHMFIVAGHKSGCTNCRFPSGIIQSNWNDTEKINGSCAKSHCFQKRKCARSVCRFTEVLNDTRVSSKQRKGGCCQLVGHSKHSPQKVVLSAVFSVVARSTKS